MYVDGGYRIDPDYRGASLKSEEGTKPQTDLVWCKGIRMSPQAIRNIFDLSLRVSKQYQERYGKDWGKYVSGELKDPDSPFLEIKKPLDTDKKPKQPKRKYNSAVYEGLSITELAKKYGLPRYVVAGRYQKGIRGKELVALLRSEISRYYIMGYRKDKKKRIKFPSIARIADYLGVTIYSIEKAIRESSPVEGYLVYKELDNK